jgi:hypothetical protein
MVLNIDNDIRVDVDQVAMVSTEAKVFIVGGLRFNTNKENIEIIAKAFDQLHHSYMVDKNLKKMRGN